jgi:SAM-dependent methyltransferase
MRARPRSDFDQYADRYRQAVQESIAFSRTDLDFFTRAKARALLAEAARRVGDPRRLSFFDLGCGPGETDRFLEGRVGRLVGGDISPRLVEVAEDRNPWAEYGTLGQGEPLPYADDSFDVSFAICVLHHVAPPERAGLVRELARVTRREGLVVLFEHNPYNPFTRHAVARCEFDQDAVLVPRREVVCLLRDPPLTEVEASYILFFTRESAHLRWIERWLAHVPLGAQYLVSARCG